MHAKILLNYTKLCLLNLSNYFYHLGLKSEVFCHTPIRSCSCSSGVSLSNSFTQLVRSILSHIMGLPSTPLLHSIRSPFCRMYFEKVRAHSSSVILEMGYGQWGGTWQGVTQVKGSKKPATYLRHCTEAEL